MSDVRRVRVFEDEMTAHVSGDGIEMSETYRADRVIDDPNGTDALLPWEDYERLRRLMLIVDEMVGEDIKAYCSEQTNREWQNAVRELEDSDE